MPGVDRPDRGPITLIACPGCNRGIVAGEGCSYCDAPAVEGEHSLAEEPGGVQRPAWWECRECGKEYDEPRQCCGEATAAAYVRKIEWDAGQTQHLRERLASTEPPTATVPQTHGELVLEVARLKEERDKLQAFKDWCHGYLDQHDVPHHPPGPHGAEGCRIGDRMDWLMAELASLRARLSALTGADLQLKALRPKLADCEEALKKSWRESDRLEQANAALLAALEAARDWTDYMPFSTMKMVEDAIAAAKSAQAAPENDTSG